jgi:peptide/nickel transport system permease protein
MPSYYADRVAPLMKRLALVLGAAVLVSFLVFFFAHPASVDALPFSLGRLSTDEVNSLAQQLGLDRSLFEQYLIWLGQVVHGDFGLSYADRSPAGPIIFRYLPATLLLDGASLAFALLLSVLLGAAAGGRSGGARVINTFSLLGTALPPFVLGMALLWLFGLKFQVLPIDSYVPPFSEDPGGAIRHMILPVVTLGIGAAAISLRLVRANMLDVFGADARDLLTRSPLLTLLGLQAGVILGGTFVVERFFDWPGIGNLAFFAISQRDVPVLRGVVLLVALLYLALTSLITLRSNASGQSVRGATDRALPSTSRAVEALSLPQREPSAVPLSALASPLGVTTGLAARAADLVRRDLRRFFTRVPRPVTALTLSPALTAPPASGVLASSVGFFSALGLRTTLGQRRDRVAVFALIFFTIIAVVLIAPIVIGYDPGHIDISAIFLPSSPQHLLGTDDLGHDELGAVLFAARASLGISALAVGVAVIAAMFLAVADGWLGTAVALVFRALLAFPQPLLALFLVGAVGSSLPSLVIALSLAQIPPLTRVLRQQIHPSSLGAAGPWRTMLGGLVPRLTTLLRTQLLLSLTLTVLGESILGFFGLVPLPLVDWGSMMSNALVSGILDAPGLFVAPAVALAVTLLGLQLLGDAAQQEDA